MTIQGAITEGDIANYLANTPGFFERQAELLASIQLTSPHGQRAVSLQERQMEMLREKIKLLERERMAMIRHGRENEAIAERLHRFIRAILLARTPGGLPLDLVQSLQHQFLIPQAAIRLWGLADAYQGLPYAADVGDEVRKLADGLTLPFCGLNSGFEPAAWLEDASTVMSIALVPLRVTSAGAGDAEVAAGSAFGPAAGAAFGLLVLGSPDPTRYSADMGTDFLVRIGEVASAALSRLLPA
jgi:uncharacterized protein YigA (DUF484 family)